MRKFEATAGLREGAGSCYKDGRQTQPYFLPRRCNRSIGFAFMCSGRLAYAVGRFIFCLACYLPSVRAASMRA
jgi:hypothetical protein